MTFARLRKHSMQVNFWNVSVPRSFLPTLDNDAVKFGGCQPVSMDVRW